MKLPPLYSKTSKGVLNLWTIETKGFVIVTVWGPYDGKLQTNRVVVDGKNVGRSNETTPEEQAVLEAKSKWEAKKLKKYYESPEEAMNTMNIKPMLAYKLDDKRAKKLTWPVDVQPKFDGVRCMAYNRPDGAIRLMSRGGKDYTVPLVSKELEGRIPPGMCLDGELFVSGESLQSIRHLMAEEDPRVKFYVYDYTSLPAGTRPWRERCINLEDWFLDHGSATWSCIVLVSTFPAADMQTVSELHDHFVDQGYEGAMVRTHTGPYKLAGKSTDLLKVKMFQDAEFKVVRWNTSKDGVILFTCIQEEGLEFDVRPVGTMEERARMLENADRHLGQWLTVKFQDRSDDNIPKFGVGKSFRPTEDLD